MIIVNGTIEPKHKVNGGIDENTGYPVPATETWSAPIDCQFFPNKRNNLGYEILVTEEDWLWDSEIIRLTTQFGRVVGEFPIIAVEHLKAVGQTQILV